METGFPSLHLPTVYRFQKVEAGLLLVGRKQTTCLGQNFK